MTESEPLATGTRLDGYRILSFLGKGGMGSVYRARDEALGRDVALKVIRAEKRDPQAEARFAREMEAASKVAHPNIVRVHASGSALGMPYIVTDFVQGETLDALVRREGKLEPRRAATFGAKLGRALAALHAAGIVHRDVKPANVLVDELGEPRLMDFGLAKLEGAGSLTETHQLLGTPTYAAPEQLAGQEVDARADVYALGATVYELVAGGPPFRGENLAAIVIAKMKAPALPVPPGELEAAVRLVCLRCLLPEPRLRWSSAAEVANELERAIGPEPRRRPWQLPLGALGLAVVALAAVLLVRSREGGSLGSSVAPLGTRGTPFQPVLEREDLALADRFGAEATRFAAERATALIGQPHVAAGIVRGFLEYAGGFSAEARTRPGVLARIRAEDVDRLLVSLQMLLDNNPIDGRMADEAGLDPTRARRLPIEGWRRGALVAILSRLRPTAKERWLGPEDLEPATFVGAPPRWSLVYHMAIVDRVWETGPGPIARDATVAAVESALAERAVFSRPPADWCTTMRKAGQLLALMAASDATLDRPRFFAAAERALDEALAARSLPDDTWRVREEIGRLLLVEERDAEALETFDLALREREAMEPGRKKEDDLAGLRSLRALAAASARLPAAAALVRQELLEQPSRVDGRIASALVLAGEGRWDQARDELATADRLLASDGSWKLTILPVAHYRAKIEALERGR
jgi:hypothetical protein